MIAYKGKEEGISPVLAVVAMVSVTIILVILVSVFVMGVFSPPANTVSAEISYVQTTSENDLQYQEVSGDSFSLDRLRVIYTLKDSQDVSMSFVLQGKMLSPGTRFIAGNLDELKENAEFLHEFATKTVVYVNYMFYDKESGSLVSSGTIPLPGDAV